MKISRQLIWRCCIVVFSLVVLFLVVAIWHPLEPRYEGKRLTTWAAELPDWEHRDFSDAEEARAAEMKLEKASEPIRHIGAKALPLGLAYCGAHDSAVTEKLKSWANRQNVIKIRLLTDSDYQKLGINIFKALGPAAKPAAPSLMNLLGSNDQNVSSTAASALHEIGPDVVPSLMEALTNSNDRIRMGAASALGNFGTQASVAAPGLIDCLKDTNPHVRRGAAMSLAYVAGSTNAIITTALLACMKDSDVNVRQAAALSLEHIRKQPNTPHVPLTNEN